VPKQQIRIDIGPDLLFGLRWPLCSGHLASHRRSAAQPLIQSEFSILKANLMAVPRIVAIFPVSARVQLGDSTWSAAGFQPGDGEQSMRAARKTRN
jgi:hypothetical protein